MLAVQSKVRRPDKIRNRTIACLEVKKATCWGNEAEGVYEVAEGVRLGGSLQVRALSRRNIGLTKLLRPSDPSQPR